MDKKVRAEEKRGGAKGGKGDWETRSEKMEERKEGWQDRRKV